MNPIEDRWQQTYNSLDTAISNAVLVSSDDVLSLACAMRDRMQQDFGDHLLSYAADKLDGSGPMVLPESPEMYQGSHITYDHNLLNSNLHQLREMFVRAAKNDLEIGDE